MKPFLLALSFLAISIFTSCSGSDNEDPQEPPPNLSISSSSVETQNWCVYFSTRQCFAVTSSECPGEGGILALSCPYSSSSSVDSEVPPEYDSSSSVDNNGSSSSSSSTGSSDSSSSNGGADSSSSTGNSGSSSSSENTDSSSSTGGGMSSSSSSSVGGELCGSNYYNPNTQLCLGGVVYELCNEMPYSATTSFCFGGEIYDRCGKSDYNPETNFCSDNKVYALCNKGEYNTSTKFCDNDVLRDKCGGNTYNGAIEACCGSKVYTLANQICNGGVIYGDCNGRPYNESTQTCSGGNVYGDCNGKPYNVAIQYCEDGKIEQGGKLVCRMTATAGTVGQMISPAPVVTCNGAAVSEGIEWQNNPPASTGNVAVAATATCVGISKTAACGSVSVQSVLIDGYKTVVIDGQTWMAEDFSVNDNFCGVSCPAGWRLPIEEEWEGIITFAGGISKLKAKSGWSAGGTGTDDFGLALLDQEQSCLNGQVDRYMWCSSGKQLKLNNYSSSYEWVNWAASQCKTRCVKD